MGRKKEGGVGGQVRGLHPRVQGSRFGDLRGKKHFVVLRGRGGPTLPPGASGSPVLHRPAQTKYIYLCLFIYQ